MPPPATIHIRQKSLSGIICEEVIIIKKFYGRYGDLIKQYEVPLSRVLHDILDDDHLQWYLHWSDITPIFDPITDLDLITEFDLLPNCEWFP